MFTKWKVDSVLDREIASALEELETHRDDPEKYKATINRITQLQQAKPTSTLFKLPLETILICSANIFGVLWIARYERENAEIIKAPNALRSVIRLK